MKNVSGYWKVVPTHLRESGIASAVEDGVTGLLLSQARIGEELPRALLTLLNDEALRTSMGA